MKPGEAVHLLLMLMLRAHAPQSLLAQFEATFGSTNGFILYLIKPERHEPVINMNDTFGLFMAVVVSFHLFSVMLTLFGGQI